MFYDILDKKRIAILPLLREFKEDFYLVGGTAIALYLGHRRSIDFDMFSYTPIVKHRIKRKLLDIPFKQIPIYEDVDQLHVMINEVKITFFHYPFDVDHPEKFNNYFSMPTLLSLSAMKAFALSRRAKWKDYVDLFFIIKDYYSIDQISLECKRLFGDQYAEKLFRQQLAFHKDIDYTEPVEYLMQSIPENEIREFLTDKAISIL